GERDPEIEDAAELAAVFEGAFPEGVDDFERVAPYGDDEDGADGQRDGDGQEEEGELGGDAAGVGHWDWFKM
ncbi:MAG: hypothetical protein OXG78_15890, partial [Chloroflexi bacterium]|nr:hypothetical protein [Chloroflexota bacterium]